MQRQGGDTDYDEYVAQQQPFIDEQHDSSQRHTEHHLAEEIEEAVGAAAELKCHLSEHSLNAKKLTCCEEVFTVFLFCFMNFLNFINRYATPPIVSRLKVAFNADDTDMGMVQTGFELCYVVAAPIFGYLGDRYSRRYILAGSLLFSTASGVLSSFVPESSFLALLLTRSLLGIAEASYTNICPSIIGDLFVGKKRTLVLTVYQFAIPLGCGCGYLLAGMVASYFNDWRWAFRITPLPMLICSLCLLAFIREPERGEAECRAGVHSPTTYREDVSYLWGIHSFMLTTYAFVGVAFATGALCYWTPDLILRMLKMTNSHKDHSDAEVNLIFGVVTIFSGVFGVVSGVLASNFLLKPFIGLSADGLVCGIAMIFASISVYFALSVMHYYLFVSWILIFFGIAALSCCLVLLSEITLNVVIATRRASAEAFQTTLSHLFGDAAAPYLTGVLSDYLRSYHTKESSHHLYVADYTAMQTSLYLSVFVIAIAAGLFLYGSLYINEDAKESRKLPGNPPPSVKPDEVVTNVLEKGKVK